MRNRLLGTAFLFAIAGTLLYAPAGVSRDLAVESEDAAAKAFCDAFMAKVAADDLPGAFATLRTAATLPLPEIDTLERQTVTQRSVVAPRFGKSVGTEFVRKEAGGNSLIRFTYIEKFERHALRWMFTFYKPANQWRFNGLSWDDRIQELLEPVP